jgi:hypothetical protein
MRCVAFMRNVNQGQRGHPATADILAGFADAGCHDAQTFQSNGTIVFDSDAPSAVVEQAADAIAVRSGHDREILWIPLSELAAVVDQHGVTPEQGRFEFTLYRGANIDPHDARVMSRSKASPGGGRLLAGCRRCSGWSPASAGEAWSQGDASRSSVVRGQSEVFGIEHPDQPAEVPQQDAPEHESRQQSHQSQPARDVALVVGQNPRAATLGHAHVLDTRIPR